jgi:glutathione S-transferase
MARLPRLITIAFSHFCEKARWALDRAGIAYVEDAHLPLFSYVPLLRARAKRTAPALVTGDGEVLSDSTDILRWCDARGDAEPLFPDDDRDVAALEDDFDRRLGPASRRLGYFHLLDDAPAVANVMSKHGPTWERTVGTYARPLAVALIRRGLRVDAAGAARSREVMDRTFDTVEARLADGRRYLCGDRLTAADLTFASLAAPLLLPDGYASYLPDPPLVPPALRQVSDAYRARPAGKFGLRMYDER